MPNTNILKAFLNKWSIEDLNKPLTSMPLELKSEIENDRNK